MKSGGCPRLLEVYQYAGAWSAEDLDKAIKCGASQQLLHSASGPHYAEVTREPEVIDGYTPQKDWGDTYTETMKNQKRMERENREKLTDPNDPRLRGRR